MIERKKIIFKESTKSFENRRTIFGLKCAGLLIFGFIIIFFILLINNSDYVLIIMFCIGTSFFLIIWLYGAFGIIRFNKLVIYNTGIKIDIPDKFIKFTDIEKIIYYQRLNKFETILNNSDIKNIYLTKLNKTENEKILSRLKKIPIDLEIRKD